MIIKELATVFSHRLEVYHFQVPASCMTIANLDLFFSSETGVNYDIRSSKITNLNKVNVTKPLAQSFLRRGEELSVSTVGHEDRVGSSSRRLCDTIVVTSCQLRS